MEAMSTKSIFAIALLCGGLALGGCGSTSIDTTAGRDGLVNTTWWVQTIEGEAIAPDSGSQVTIDEDGYIVASEGCAKFTGKAAVNGNRFDVTKIGLVDGACANAAPLQEAKLIDTLERVDRWAVQESYLLLYSEGSTIPTRLARHP
jgi:heat shock protein HslJ